MSIRDILCVAISTMVLVGDSQAFFMWTAPFPAWNQTNPGTQEIQTTVMGVLNGSKNHRLQWNYTLQPSQSLTFAFFGIGDGSSQPDTIGYALRGISTINNRHEYQRRFNIASTSEFSTLIIREVTQREEATFQCRLQVDSNTWAYNVRIYVADPPRITHISGNQTFKKGDIVSLNCTASGNPAPNISWSRVSDGSVVTFPLNVTSHHNGAYRCTADNGYGDPSTAVVSVSIQTPSDIRYISGNLTVNRNENVTLLCKAEGNPKPNVTWRRLNDGRFTTFPLTITGKEDAGGYRCTAGNGVGDPAVADVFIAVLIPPEITFISSNQTANQHDLVTLNCSADGNPRPNISWTRVYDNTIVAFPLTIVSKQDEGAYRCTAHNGIGSPATEEVFIEMKNYRPMDTSLTVNMTGNDTIIVNTIIDLLCSAKADPPAKYRFYKGLESLCNTTLESNAATFTTLVRERKRQVKFRCTPFNDFGEGPTRTINLTVRYPPAISYVSPEREEYVEGNDALLFCNATGNPPPSIYWTKQGSNFALSSSETLHLTSLRVDDGAVYRCKAENYLGSSETNITITVQRKPSVKIRMCTTPVMEGRNASLECATTGIPVPSIAWIRASTREVVSYKKTLVIEAIQRNHSGSYQCLAWNRVGNSSVSCTIDVHYPPSDSSLKAVHGNTTVLRGSSITLICSTDANPGANVFLFYFNLRLLGVSNSGVINVTVEEDGIFTCIPVNPVGSGRTSQSVIVVANIIRLEVPVEKLNGLEAEYREEYDDLNSVPAKAFVDEFVNEMKKVYTNNTIYERAIVTGLRSGSIIVNLEIHFKTPVSTDEGLSTLRNVVSDGSLGPFTVGTLKIITGVLPPSTTEATFTPADVPKGKTSTSLDLASKNETITTATPPQDANKVSSDSKGTTVGPSVAGNLLVVIFVIIIMNMIANL